MSSSLASPDQIVRRFHEIDASLTELIDRNPMEAISAARGLTPDEVLDEHNIDALKGGALVDAGVAAKEVSAVNEGVALLERLAIAQPERGDVRYCLANGLLAQADFVATSVPNWYLETAGKRRAARGLYQAAAADPSTPSDIAAQAFTNLGNSMLRAYRFVEAYDYYARALVLDPTNGVASTGSARVLLRYAAGGTGDANTLRGVAARHLNAARENPARIRELAGERAYRELASLLETEIPEGTLPDLASASSYQRFVAENRLALSPTIEGLDLSLSRWDSLRLGSISGLVSEWDGVPSLFAMFNILKSDFLAARYLAYLALHETLPESGKYSDSLDYARYGIQPSMLTLAQRASMDLLDKVAIAASDYLHLSGAPKSINFANRWFKSPKETASLAWHTEVRDEIEAGNTASYRHIRGFWGLGRWRVPARKTRPSKRFNSPLYSSARRWPRPQQRF